MSEKRTSEGNISPDDESGKQTQNPNQSGRTAQTGSTPTGQAPQGDASQTEKDAGSTYQPGQGGMGGSGYQPGQSEMAGGTTSRPGQTQSPSSEQQDETGHGTDAS
jgi:hypothetical protein